MKTIHFYSSLPRSCSTLLCNVLAQNPRIHATASSGLIDLIYPSRKNLADLGEFKAMDPKDAENMFLDWARGGIVNAYNSITDRPIVFDKGRSWMGYLDLVFQMFPEAKVVISIRDMRGIMASMEKISRKHPAYFQAEEVNPQNFLTTEKRVKAWTAGKVGIAIERLYEVSNRFKDKVHFVHAEDLTENPKQTLMKLYTYLGEEYYEGHDFNNVEQYTKEHDGVWWPHGDHTIKGSIKPLKKEWNDVLGKELSDVINQKFNWINEL